jgi:hypothetical protein
VPKAQVISMRGRAADELPAPWASLGYDSEREMLLDDLKMIATRLKDPGTPAHAIAALSKRKTEILEQIKLLDSGELEADAILDDSEDEAWNVGG